MQLGLVSGTVLPLRPNVWLGTSFPPQTCVACYEKADYERLIFDGLSERGVDHIEL